MPTTAEMFPPKLTNGWHQLPIDQIAMLRAIMPHDGSTLMAYQKRLRHDEDLSAMVECHPETGHWHLSISHQRQDTSTGVWSPGRLPTWEEIVDARYRFVPDEVTMAMLLPPRSEYVNVHATTMHLHQIPPQQGG